MQSSEHPRAVGRCKLFRPFDSNPFIDFIYWVIRFPLLVVEVAQRPLCRSGQFKHRPARSRCCRREHQVDGTPSERDWPMVGWSCLHYSRHCSTYNGNYSISRQPRSSNKRWPSNCYHFTEKVNCTLNIRPTVNLVKCYLMFTNRYASVYTKCSI